MARRSSPRTNVRETFQSSTRHGGGDGEGRALRYLEWAWDPDPADSTYVVDFAYLLREGLTVRHEQDRHVFGLFGREEWKRLIVEGGFEARVFEAAGAEREEASAEVYA